MNKVADCSGKEKTKGDERAGTVGKTRVKAKKAGESVSALSGRGMLD